MLKTKKSIILIGLGDIPGLIILDLATHFSAFIYHNRSNSETKEG